MFEAFVLLGILVVGAGVFAALYLLRQKSGSDHSVAQVVMEFQKELSSLRGSVQDQMQTLGKQVQDQLSLNSKMLLDGQTGYSKAVGQVENRLGELQAATRSMMEIGKDISSLQNILRSPKLRGGIGELMLGELLRQILPEDHFSLQYSFNTGNKVDAVILLGQGMIPVDAKFPLENFRRIQEAQGEENSLAMRKEFAKDVKKHIDAIADKYILPAEGTFEFALMYIPAENVYYETIIKDEFQTESIAAYAMKKKVIPVSPNSFYAYLQAIVRGLKGMRIERSAQLILESLGQLETDFKRVMEDFEKVDKHLSNSRSAFDSVRKGMQKMETKLASLENKADKTLVSDTPAPIAE